MKKVFLLGIIMFLFTSCTSINNSDIDTIINNSFNSSVKTLNTSKKGYRYYLPKGLVIKNSDSYNEVISSEKYTFYLYVDLVSYFNKTDFTYKENKDAYYSLELNNNGKKGYIEINNYKNDKYLIEIMYNYAKIEVVVMMNDINISVANAMAILSSITYNDNVIKNYMTTDEYRGAEEKFDIFEIVGSDNYLQFADDENDNEDNRDPDYIK